MEVGGIRGLNGNGDNTIKIKLKNKIIIMLCFGWDPNRECEK